MKKAFKWGFIIGVLYISVFALIANYGGSEGWGMLFAILVQPASLIVNGLLEYLLKMIGLRDLFFNNFFVFWSLLALTQGIFFGLLFKLVGKLFSAKPSSLL